MRGVLVFLWVVPLALRGQQVAPWNPDANGDGCVTTSDLISLLNVFGLCPEPLALPCTDSTAFVCGDTVIFDAHGYATVLIGNQCWFAENLRTSVYRNGDSIPAGLSDSGWITTTSGATATYGEGSSACQDDSPTVEACDEGQSIEAFGRLYNWYAVDDARGLCPSGWHVPTDGEWTALADHLTSQGFNGTEGTALKATTGWTDNGNGSDDVGFSAAPGGNRYHDNGGFSSVGFIGYWWTASSASGVAWSRALTNGLPGVWPNTQPLRDGFSVRCLLGE